MRLKEIREARGISQRQAALALNLSPTVYNRYENGIREPSNALLLVLADYFGVTVDELLGRDADENQNANGPQTLEARIISGGVDKMPKEDREFALRVFNKMFAEYADKFEKDDDDDAT